MPFHKLLRFAVRPEARTDVERAMHELATYVRTELPRSGWTVYRDPQEPTHFTALVVAEDPAAMDRHFKAPGVVAFDAQLAPLLVGTLEITDCELVTSSDLQRRHRKR